MTQVPRILYRGIKIAYHLLQEIKLYGVPITPAYSPLIDKFGRKTVNDGNEYGIYMTDNLTMCRQAYGCVGIMDGTNLRKDLRLNIDDRPTPLNIPAVGIVYKIDTNGMQVRKPWISSQLTGHYNNGFAGNEWIADTIPSQNYTVMEATISSDWLHDSEKIDISDIAEAEKQIKSTVEARKQRLEILGKELEKLERKKRLRLTEKDRQLYRDLYGYQGVRYIGSNKIQINEDLDYIKYLLSIFYEINPEQLDYNTLKYIETLKSRMEPENTTDKLLELINSDLTLNNKRRQEYIEIATKLGEEIDTSTFDRKQIMYNKVLAVLKAKIESVKAIKPRYSYQGRGEEEPIIDSTTLNRHRR